MTSTTTTATTTATSAPAELVVDAGEIAAGTWRPFADQAGVRDRAVWQDPATGSYAGVLQLAPGSHIDPHTHRRAAHHLWVAAGRCTIAGRSVPAGSYLYVPAGVEHAVGPAGRAGCTLFYLYLRPPTTAG